MGKGSWEFMGKDSRSLWGKAPGSLQEREFDGFKFFKLRFGNRNGREFTEEFLPKLQSSFYRIASAGLVK